MNIFVVVALAPANRKSAVFKAICHPLECHERLESQRLAPEIARAAATSKIKEARLKKLQAQAASAVKAVEQAKVTDDAISLAAEISASKVLVAPRYIADDCTPERLATLLRDQGGRLAILTPEGDVFDLMAGRYSSTSESNLGVYLKGHAGDDLRLIASVGLQSLWSGRP
jgi:replicative DNA helicase